MEAKTLAVIGIACWLASAGSIALAAARSPEPAAKPAPADAAPKKDAADADAKGVKAAGPRLQMGERSGKAPGEDRDLRECLDLPSPKDVIRCYEKTEKR
jgi:hypothetical protein